MPNKTITIHGDSQSRTKLCVLCCSEFQKPGTDSWNYFLNRRMFCGPVCQGLAHSLAADMNRAPIDVVFQKWFEKTNGCWEWQGARDRDGYGLFSYAGKLLKAHRVALEIEGHEIPDGYYSCHKCNNPPCVNPAHLYVGTPAQNNRDKIAAGTHTCGEKTPFAKMTEPQVRKILRGGKSDAEFAAEFGVSNGAVSLARNRKTWKHVRV